VNIRTPASSAKTCRMGPGTGHGQLGPRDLRAVTPLVGRAARINL